jgi:putative ABC transport system substrate-binding protein
VKRREFITLLGCGAATWPIAARAQQSDRMRQIAVLMNNAEDDPEGQARAAAFRQGLQALGWTEGKNLRIDWHWTAGDVGRIRSDVRELAGRPPDIIVANGRANRPLLTSPRMTYPCGIPLDNPACLIDVREQC